VVGVSYVEGDERDKWFKVMVYENGQSFSGVVTAGDDGSSRGVGFVDFRKHVK